MNYYRSGFEGMVSDDLRERGVTYDYESEVIVYKSRVRGALCEECGAPVMKPRKYTPDFIIYRGMHRPKLYVEAKGRFPSTDRSKMRDVKRLYPDMDLRLLFQKTSKSEMAKLQAWCDKFKFPCAFGHQVPEEWLR